jgi:hypothetical protein
MTEQVTSTSDNTQSTPPPANTEALMTKQAAPPDVVVDADKKVDATVPEWLKTIEDKELLESSSLKKFHDIKSLAKSYIHAEKSIGKNKIVIPDKHATAEDWDNVLKQLGRPDSADGYDLGVKSPYITEAEVGVMKNLVAKSGLLPAQAKRLVENYEAYLDEAHKNLTANQEAALNEQKENLKKEWGDAFVRKTKEAEAAFSAVCDENDWKYIEEKGLNHDPNFVKIFSKLHDKFLKEGTIKGASQGVDVYTPDEAQQKINMILGDTKHPYYDKSHPNHGNAVSEIQKLFTQLKS